MEKITAWLAENFKRMALKTPRFFQVWQTIGIICLAVGFIPELLTWLEVTTTDIVSKYIALAVKVAGGVLWFMAKIPFDQNDPALKNKETGQVSQQKMEQKLPFTEGTNP